MALHGSLYLKASESYQVRQVPKVSPSCFSCMGYTFISRCFLRDTHESYLWKIKNHIPVKPLYVFGASEVRSRPAKRLVMTLTKTWRSAKRWQEWGACDASNLRENHEKLSLKPMFFWMSSFTNPTLDLYIYIQYITTVYIYSIHLQYIFTNSSIITWTIRWGALFATIHIHQTMSTPDAYSNAWLIEPAGTWLSTVMGLVVQ